MLATSAEVERRTISNSAVPIPPRPAWLPRPRRTIPPRPEWLPKRAPAPVARRLIPPKGTTAADGPAHRSRYWRRDGTSFLVSLTVHGCLLLLVWLMFRVATRSQPFGYVISCEISDGEGAESERLTMIDSPVPKIEEQTTPNAAAVEATRAPDGAAVAVSNGGGGSGVGFFGSRAVANSVVFVVDKSGSMSHGTRMMTAKQELKNALRQLQPHQGFYVIFYDDDMLRMLAPDSPDSLLPATRNHINDVLAWMESDVAAAGGTDPLQSLITALAMAPEVIFFLTDGDVKPHVPAAIFEENRHHTTIHTLCFSDDFGEEVMRLIAHENRGRYRFVDSPGEDRSRPRRPSREDRAAIAKLRNARKYLIQGREAVAERWLRKLIAEHPGSPPAQQAQRLLDSLSAAP